MISKQEFDEVIQFGNLDPEKLPPAEALDFLDKSGKTLKLLIEYIGKGAAIIFAKGSLPAMKWYNIKSLIMIYGLGKLFIELIVAYYNIWKKKENGDIQAKS